MQLNISRKQGYPQLKGKNRTRYCARVDYLFSLAEAHRRSIRDWEMEEFIDYTELDSEGHPQIPGKKELTKKFIERIQKENTPGSPVPALDRLLFEAFEKAMTVHGAVKAGEARADYLQYAMESDSLTAQLMTLHRAMASKRRVWDFYGSGFRPTIQSRIERILADGFYEFYEFDEPNLIVRFVTPSIHLDEVNKDAGVDLHVDLGRYVVAISAFDLDLKVSRFERNIAIPYEYKKVVYQVIHPCIKENNTICWGELLPKANEAIKQLDAYALLNYLRSLFYSLGAPPYRSLSDFQKHQQAERDVVAGIKPIPDPGIRPPDSIVHGWSVAQAVRQVGMDELRNAVEQQRLVARRQDDQVQYIRMQYANVVMGPDVVPQINNEDPF